MNSDRATNIKPGAPAADATWICGLLQAGDSFYPTGSYAHSFGLEGLVQEGVVRDRETLRQYLLLAVRPALQRTELPLAVHAWSALATPDWKEVGAICELAHALKPAREARLAAEKIGRQRAEFIGTLRPHALVAAYLHHAAVGLWPFAPPVSAALEGRVLGAPLDAVLAGVYYSAVVSLLASAMKLLRLGQNGAQTLLTEMLVAAPAGIAAAKQIPLDEIGWFNPWLDIAAARHEIADGRLFIS